MSKEDNLDNEKDIGNIHLKQQPKQKTRIYLISREVIFEHLSISQFLLMFTLSVHQNLDIGLEEFFREPMLSDFMVL